MTGSMSIVPRNSERADRDPVWPPATDPEDPDAADGTDSCEERT